MVCSSPHPDVDIPDRSLPDFVLGAFEGRDGQPVLIDGPSGRTLTYGDLGDRVTACAGGLARRGFEAGEVFAIYSPNLPEYAIAFYGVARAGGTVTTINPLYTAEEASRQLRDANARYLLTVPHFSRRPRRRPRRQTSTRSSYSARPTTGQPPSTNCCAPPASPRTCPSRPTRTSSRFPA
jgi:acyl-CoA synthetase (AMP-forming)/AMP-acid ligase II